MRNLCILVTFMLPIAASAQGSDGMMQGNGKDELLTPEGNNKYKPALAVQRESFTKRPAA